MTTPKSLLALACVVFASGCGSATRSSSPSGEPTAGHTSAPSGETEGAKLYARYCALCHGERAEGYAADNANALANQEFLSTAGDSFLRFGIAYGRPGTAMSAFHESQGGPLDDEQIWSIVQHLRALQTKPSVELDDGIVQGDPERALGLYERLCAGCHGDEGEGAAAGPSLANPVFLMTASDGFLRYAIEHGRSQTPMAGYADELAPRDIDDLTALIRSWATSPDLEPVSAKAVSFDDPVINAEGHAPPFGDLREGRYVPAEEVHDALVAGARMILLDARPASDWIHGHIPGALPAPFYDAETIADALPNDDTYIVIYCACPHAASGIVMDVLRDRGFSNTAVIDEGVLVWATRGYPIVSGRDE
jgi:cytochrome c oxidase cbb3-type subunit III